MKIKLEVIKNGKTRKDKKINNKKVQGKLKKNREKM